MTWCLIQEYKDKFLQALKDGSISPEKLLSIRDSSEREAYLAKYVGEWNAKYVNTEFESKLLLKNQKAGLINWAKKIAGITETTRTDIIDKIGKLETALNPDSKTGILGDIVDRRIGINPTAQEAKDITQLSSLAKNAYDPTKKDWEQPLDYWKARQKLDQYLRSKIPETTSKGFMDKRFSFGGVKFSLNDILSVERAIKVGFNFHSAFRQGRALFGTKEWFGAFARMFDYASNSESFNNLEASMHMNPYSEYALANKRELGLTMLGEKFTTREEDFGAKIIDKTPLLRGAERGFVGFLNDLRFNRFVDIMSNLDKSGNGITDQPEAQKELAKVIGAATGRGYLGKWEGAANPLATVMFSPRFFASRFQLVLNTLTKSGPARIEAIKSLALWAGTTVGILKLMQMAGAKIETDPTSADFGLARFGNTRFDVSGGMMSYITFIARLIEGKTKSATTGKISQLNSGKFGSQTDYDLVLSFLTNKASPVAGVVRDFLKGQTFEGQKLSLSNIELYPDMAKYVVDQLFNPLTSDEAIQAYNQGAGNTSVWLAIGSAVGSMFGVTSQTYYPKSKVNKKINTYSAKLLP